MQSSKVVSGSAALLNVRDSGITTPIDRQRSLVSISDSSFSDNIGLTETSCLSVDDGGRYRTEVTLKDVSFSSNQGVLTSEISFGSI